MQLTRLGIYTIFPLGYLLSIYLKNDFYIEHYVWPVI
jgi:hypothetical protein